MPSPDLGYSAPEIIALLKSYIGNKSQDFETYLSYELPLAEYRYCKLHEWSFLYKTNLTLEVVSGAPDFVLDQTTVGYYVAASDIIDIRDAANNRLLRKTTIDEIRRMDPNNDDGSASSGGVYLWAPAGDNKIVFYPPNFTTTEVQIDAKITPFTLPTKRIQGLTYTVISANNRVTITIGLATDSLGAVSSTDSQIAAMIASNPQASALVSVGGSGGTPVMAQQSVQIIKYLTVPPRYQDTYIEWLKAVVLDRENDTRAQGQRIYAAQLVKKDIEDDLSGTGDTMLPRLRAAREQFADGRTGNMDELYNLWAFYSE